MVLWSFCGIFAHVTPPPPPHTHTHVGFYGLRGLSIGVMFLYCTNCMCYCPTPALHLNLALTGDGAFLFSLKKTHSVWFISVLSYGDTENVLINHLLLVIPMSYPCHYTNLCPHKPHKHAHTHTHTEQNDQCGRGLVSHQICGTRARCFLSLQCNILSSHSKRAGLHTPITLKTVFKTSLYLKHT